MVLGKKGADMKGHCRGQQGAILVLTAFLLPFIIAFTGLAVDLGNLYVQHQTLQNTADAAALAGANNFTADKKDIPAAKKNADQYANQNGDINYGGSMKNASVSMETKIDNNAKPNYYGVHMTKSVPVYFLSIFPKIDDTCNVDAYATAKLTLIEENNNEGVLLDALMMLSSSLYVVGETGSTDPNQRNNIKVTFDGKIVSTDPRSKESSNSIVYKEQPYYDQWGRPVRRKVFLTSKAKDEGISVAEALSKDVNSGYWYYADHDFDYDYYNEDNPIVKTFTSKKAVELTSDQVNNNQIPNIKDNEYIYVKYNSSGSNNLNLSNLNEWSGDPNKPIFIMVDPLVETKIELRNDTTRPLIIYYRKLNPDEYPVWVRIGIAQGWVKPKVTIEQNGHVFRGIVYNPEGLFHTNANGGTIKGSIVAADVDLQGAPGRYVYEGFTASGGSGGNSGSGGISQSGHIPLVSNDNINWKE